MLWSHIHHVADFLSWGKQRNGYLRTVLKFLSAPSMVYAAYSYEFPRPQASL